MSKTWPKIIRDPVHNIIPFENTECDRLLLNLINSREFQRLRRIKQLGLCEMVFPGANHSRFAHSIGVMHTARMFLERIERVMGKKLDEDKRTLVLSAALLHDLGHGPFSHAFEKVTRTKHEERTLEIIQDESTEIHARLSEMDKQWPQKFPVLLAPFFYKGAEDGDKDDGNEKPIVEGYFTQIVSSQLDADRFDYLIRDSDATGTDYGNFDLRWIIQHFYLNEGKGRFYLEPKPGQPPKPTFSPATTCTAPSIFIKQSERRKSCSAWRSSVTRSCCRRQKLAKPDPGLCRMCILTWFRLFLET